MAGDDRQYMTEGQMRWKGLKIAVVEDDTVHAAVLTRYLETWMQGRNIAFCIRKFPDAAAFLFEWEQDQAWNALFFDIQMPGLNGVELAKKIRREDRRVAIVFVTGVTDYLLEGYEVEALYYLVKPVDAEKISICMERILARYNEQERQRVILAEAEEYANGKPVSRVTLWLLPEDIVYVEAFSHNTALYTKEKCYLVREGISVWRERLAGEVFCSCHRSISCALCDCCSRCSCRKLPPVERFPLGGQLGILRFPCLYRQGGLAVHHAFQIVVRRREQDLLGLGQRLFPLVLEINVGLLDVLFQSA